VRALPGKEYEGEFKRYYLHGRTALQALKAVLTNFDKTPTRADIFVGTTVRARAWSAAH
jgi:hypothetical protein